VKAMRNPYYLATNAFSSGGGEQFVEVLNAQQTVRRSDWQTRAAIDEVVCPIAPDGCYIHGIVASRSGSWLVTQRISGQGEWGYDVFRTSPLSREAGVITEPGYMLELPRFSEDESVLIGAFGEGFLGGWWAHPDDDLEDPARGGPVRLGFLWVHHLPSHHVERCELTVVLPEGWRPEDPWSGWEGPDVTPSSHGVTISLSWGGSIEVHSPFPPVIRLPTPHPSGKGLLQGGVAR
jgi:hypothetical protein